MGRGVKWAAIRRLINKENIQMICLQETKKDSIDKTLCQAIWGSDFMGPFPSCAGNEYILVVVDYVSKWVEVMATSRNDAKTVVKFIKKNIFSQFGVPRILISDGGSHFCNTQLQKVLGQYHVNHRVASPYHPQTNGQVKVSSSSMYY